MPKRLVFICFDCSEWGWLLWLTCFTLGGQWGGWAHGKVSLAFRGMIRQIHSTKIPINTAPEQTFIPFVVRLVPVLSHHQYAPPCMSIIIVSRIEGGSVRAGALPEWQASYGKVFFSREPKKVGFGAASKYVKKTYLVTGGTELRHFANRGAGPRFWKYVSWLSHQQADISAAANWAGLQQANLCGRALGGSPASGYLCGR